MSVLRVLDKGGLCSSPAPLTLKGGIDGWTGRLLQLQDLRPPAAQRQRMERVREGGWLEGEEAGLRSVQ